MGASYLAVAMAQYVTFQGMQLPHFHDSHLRTLHPTQLREHANLLYSTIGHSNLGRAVPMHDHELIEFIIFVQNAHLAPLLLVAEAPSYSTMAAAPMTYGAPSATYAGAVAAAPVTYAAPAIGGSAGGSSSHRLRWRSGHGAFG